MSNYAVYSDNGGITWQTSKNAACTNGDEAKVVELTNGNILMSIRNRAKGHRLFSFSTDGGETWSEPSEISFPKTPWDPEGVLVNWVAFQVRV